MPMNTLRQQYLNEYQSWVDMKARCYNKNNKRYCNYGSRGIIVCAQWCISFKTFLHDMGTKPKKGWHIHRKEVNGNYEPDNCIWIDPIIHRYLPRG